MKMIMAVIPHDHSRMVLDALIEAGYSATFTESRGGMLRQSQHTIFIAVAKDQENPVMTIIREHCRTSAGAQVRDQEQSEGRESQVTAELGGAVIFSWDIDKVHNF